MKHNCLMIFNSTISFDLIQSLKEDDQIHVSYFSHKPSRPGLKLFRDGSDFRVEVVYQDEVDEFIPGEDFPL